MKKLRISAAVMSVIFGWSIVGWSENDIPVTTATKSNEKKTPPVTTNSSSSAQSEKTEHNFEDLLVQGKYHFSDEAVTTVEEDKVLDSLLGIRTDFKDKIEQSVGRY